jgi:hypothetical protein
MTIIAQRRQQAVIDVSCVSSHLGKLMKQATQAATSGTEGMHHDQCCHKN